MHGGSVHKIYYVIKTILHVGAAAPTYIYRIWNAELVENAVILPLGNVGYRSLHALRESLAFSRMSLRILG